MVISQEWKSSSRRQRLPLAQSPGCCTVPSGPFSSRYAISTSSSCPLDLYHSGRRKPRRSLLHMVQDASSSNADKAAFQRAERLLISAGCYFVPLVSSASSLVTRRLSGTTLFVRGTSARPFLKMTSRNRGAAHAIRRTLRCVQPAAASRAASGSGCACGS